MGNSAAASQVKGLFPTVARTPSPGSPPPIPVLSFPRGEATLFGGVVVFYHSIAAAAHNGTFVWETNGTEEFCWDIHYACGNHGIAICVAMEIPFAAQMQVDFGSVLPYGLGAGGGFGLLFGFVMAFFMRGIETSLPIRDRDEFLKRLRPTLAQLGYYPESESQSFLTFKPSFQAGLLAGRISVQLQENGAQIVGPVTYVKKLMRRLGYPT